MLIRIFPLWPSDLVQAALLICAISTAIQVTGLRYRQFQIGAGILSVMGISFTTVTLYQTSITNMMVRRFTNTCMNSSNHKTEHALAPIKN